MGNEIASQYGIGKSGAQVWGANPALASLARQYEQDRLRKEKQDAEYAAELAKINYNAVREADIPVAAKMYKSLADTNAQVRMAQNPVQRALLASKMNQQKQELMQLVGMSKEAAKMEGEIGKLPMSKPDEVSDEFYTKYPALRKLPITDPNYKTVSEDIQKTWYAPKYDPLTLINKVAPMSLRKSSDKEIERRITGGTERVVVDREKIDPEAFVAYTVAEAKDNRGLRNHIAKLYPDLEPPIATLQYAKDLADQVGQVKNTAKDRVVGTKYDDNWKAKADYAESLRRSRPDKSAEKPPLYRQDIINRFLDEDKGSGEEMFSSIRSGINTSGAQLNGKIEYRKNKNGTVDIIVPQVLKNDVTVKDGDKTETQKVERNRTVFTINPKNRESSASILNQILNTYTGEKVPESALLTPQGKKKVPGGQGEKQLRTEKKVAYAGYKVGQEEGGYRYVGGDPTKQSSWVKK